jgi:hypothetical protein
MTAALTKAQCTAAKSLNIQVQRRAERAGVRWPLARSGTQYDSGSGDGTRRPAPSAKSS